MTKDVKRVAGSTGLVKTSDGIILADDLFKAKERRQAKAKRKMLEDQVEGLLDLVISLSKRVSILEQTKALNNDD